MNPKVVGPIMLAATLLGTASAATADPLSFNFVVTGFAGGGTLTGSFTGTDSNNDQVLTYDELSSWSVAFSGDGIVPAFSHPSLANLASDTAFPSTNIFNFHFDLLSNQLDAFASCEGFSPTGCFRPTAFSSGEGFGVQFASGGPIDSAPQNAFVATRLPEPNSMTLVAAGLLALLLWRIGLKRSR